MENTNFEPTESMDIINKMINNAKSKLADDGFLLIFWGWNVVVAALIHYATLKLNIQHGEYAWAILMPLGGIVSAVYGYKQGKKKTVKTYVDSYLSYLWGAFGIALVLTLISMPQYGIKVTYFMLMILYGVATFICGGILNFKPLIIGSLFSFACAFISNFCGEMDQLLIISIALLCSYIIPGHLLRAKFKSEQHV
jgi:hypothetical protein